MKKKQNLFVGLVAALLLSSCSQEELGEQGKAWLCPKANIRYR